MQPSTTSAARGSGRRLAALVGLLLVLGSSFLCFTPLPDWRTGEATTYLERLFLAAAVRGGSPEPNVPFVGTPQTTVERMLELAALKTNDVLYDLGCGDGRFVVTAAQRFGVRAVGVDIDPVRVLESRRNVRKHGIERLVTIKQADIFELDFSDATVVTLYLLPELNVRLMPKLARLPPGTRILSYEFDMRGARPNRVIDFAGEGRQRHKIYEWIVPWEVEPVQP